MYNTNFIQALKALGYTVPQAEALDNCAEPRARKKLIEAGRVHIEVAEVEAGADIERELIAEEAKIAKENGVSWEELAAKLRESL